MFRIMFLDDFYYANETCDVTFYLDINGQAFPDDQWTDFALIVLNWWIIKILENYQSENTNFTFRFMDGPYYVDCSKHGAIVHMRCIEDKKHKTVICECDTEIALLTSELIDATTKIIELAERYDFGKLRGLNELKQSLTMLKTL